MDEQAVKKAVRNYLKDPDQYALMIDGEWGSGKTYFVENDMREAAEGYRVIRVSLFGIGKSDDLYDRIYLGIIKEYASGGEGKGKKALATEFARDAGLSFVGGIAKKAKKELGIDYEIASKGLAEFLLGERMLLVLDDLERCAMDDRELFGVIDSLVNGRSRKVVLVSNEERRESDQEDPERYRALMEKLVWKRIEYEPPIEAVVVSLVGKELDAVSEDARAIFLEALKNARCANIRTVKRLRPLLEALGKTDFFEDPSDRNTRMLVLKDVCGFAISAAEGKFPELPEVASEDTADLGEALEAQFQEDRYNRYESLAFIGACFKRHEDPDVSQIDLCLDSYREANYPESEKACAALDCVSRWNQLRFSNDEIPGMIEAMIDSIDPADGSPGLSFDKYSEVLCTAKGMCEEYPGNLETKVDDFLPLMREMIASYPEEAMESINRNPYPWQDERYGTSPVPGVRRLDEIDDLRQHAIDCSLGGAVESTRRALEESREAFSAKYRSSLASERLDPKRAAAILTSVDAATLAHALPKMQPDGLRILHEVFHGIFRTNGMLIVRLAESDKERISGWSEELAGLLVNETTEEIAVRKLISWIRNDLSELAETLRRSL